MIYSRKRPCKDCARTKSFCQNPYRATPFYFGCPPSCFNFPLILQEKKKRVLPFRYRAQARSRMPNALRAFLAPSGVVPLFGSGALLPDPGISSDNARGCFPGVSPRGVRRKPIPPGAPPNVLFPGYCGAEERPIRSGATLWPIAGESSFCDQIAPPGFWRSAGRPPP